MWTGQPVSKVQIPSQLMDDVSVCESDKVAIEYTELEKYVAYVIPLD